MYPKYRTFAFLSLLESFLTDEIVFGQKRPGGR